MFLTTTKVHSENVRQDTQPAIPPNPLLPPPPPNPYTHT